MVAPCVGVLLDDKWHDKVMGFIPKASGLKFKYEGDFNLKSLEEFSKKFVADSVESYFKSNRDLQNKWRGGEGGCIRFGVLETLDREDRGSRWN